MVGFVTAAVGSYHQKIGACGFKQRHHLLEWIPETYVINPFLAEVGRLFREGFQLFKHTLEYLFTGCRHLQDGVSFINRDHMHDVQFASFPKGYVVGFDQCCFGGFGKIDAYENFVQWSHSALRLDWMADFFYLILSETVWRLLQQPLSQKGAPRLR